MTSDEQEETYAAILQLYDLAEELVHTADSPLVSDPEAYLEMIEPIVEQLASAADMLAEEYAALVKQGAPLDAARKKKMQTALARVFVVIEQCKKYSG